ncbi:hypothetical protein FRC04_008128 [Tulasnella sp. 424]|nr:hypothetical protein FRC04_008128 [Tulasnella sp. 424]KAG8974785.1 hypothetical protein FRC05_006946 [Tulasnella sp. 425]
MSLAASAAEAQPIALVLASAASFGSSFSQITSREPKEPKKELKDAKDRWLVCTVNNITDFPILSMTSYMGSGRYDDPPHRVDPFETMTFTCCERDGKPMTGVSGGHSFHINLDGNNQFFFALGFENPFVGTFMVSVAGPDNDDEIAKLKKDDNEGNEAQSKLAEKAYSNVNGSGNMIKSPIYKAKDADGREVVFQFEISASAGKSPIYTITEVRDYLTVV